MIQKIRHLSLSKKIIYLSLFVLLSQTITSFFNINSFANNYKESISKQIVIEAANLGEQITAQLYERYGDIQAFALNPSIKNYKANFNTIPKILDQYVKLYSIYDLITVVDKNGQLVSANTKDFADKSINFSKLAEHNFKNEIWFKEVMNGKSTEDKKNNYSGTYIQDFINDQIYEKATGLKSYSTTFSAAIKNDKDEIVGVITNHAGKRWIENEIAGKWKSLHEGGLDKIQISLVNKENKIILQASHDEVNHSLLLESNAEIILNQDYTKKFKEINAVEKNENFQIQSKLINSEKTLIGSQIINNSKSIENLGWKIYIEDSTSDAFKSASASLKLFFIFFSLSFLFALVVLFFTSQKISNVFSETSEPLTKNSTEVGDAANQIATAATQLSVASREQTASLQQTVVAADEINAMVRLNSTNASRSRELSLESKLSCDEGKKVVETMLQSIYDISEVNQKSSSQMLEANSQLSEINKLFNQISNKTKVINEIVFQTKLLSFNASVEAARAGEYGKGFAVVAEEVGNLAKMSGEASKEIAIMLENSIQQVADIVKASQGKIELNISVSKEKINAGITNANLCTQSINQILSNVNTVDQMVSEIHTSCQEQASGIQQITSAINEIEQVNQQNSILSESSAAAAEQLRLQSAELSQIVTSLNSIIKGKNEIEASGFNLKMSTSSKSKIINFKNNKTSRTFLKADKNFENFNTASYKKVSGDEFPSSEDDGFKD